MSDYAHWFRETTPSLPGEALAHENLTNVVHDLALLNVIGVRLVIVHGARPQLDESLGAISPSTSRVTSEEDLPIITAEVGKLRAILESKFSAGLPGSPLHNAAINVVSGNFVVAKPLGVREGTNYKFTGQVRSLKTQAINKALDSGAIVLLPPCGFSPAGQMYNLSAEELAAETAVVLEAEKLITFAEESYIKDASGQDLPELTPGELDSLLADLPADASSHRRLAAMQSACRRGVPRCPQVSYSADGALLAELFTADGQGSQLSEEPYRNVRTATSKDLSDIIALIRPLEQQGLLVRRTRAQLEAMIDSFLIAEVDNTVVGCCSLTTYENSEAAELACLAANPIHKHSKAPVGNQLLAAVEKRARSLGATSIFVLTTATQDWFIERGFSPCAIDELPADKSANYDKQRGSQPLTKGLT